MSDAQPEELRTTVQGLFNLMIGTVLLVLVVLGLSLGFAGLRLGMGRAVKGMINGVQTFMPRMIERGQGGRARLLRLDGEVAADVLGHDLEGGEAGFVSDVHRPANSAMAMIEMACPVRDASGLDTVGAIRVLVDASALLEPPTGFVKVASGHLVQPNGRRLRIWGVNFTANATVPSKDDAPVVAEAIAQERHHFFAADARANRGAHTAASRPADRRI